MPLKDTRKTDSQSRGDSFEEYRDILQDLPVGMLIATPEGRCVQANRAVASMFGYESPGGLIESIGHVWEQLYADPEDREKIKDHLAKSNEWLTCECRFVHKDGSLLMASNHVRAIRNEQGDIAHYQSILFDITERVRAVEALLESERKYKRLAENSPGVVYQFMVAPDGTFSFPYINEAVFSLTGISPEEVIRDAAVLINKIHPEDMQKFRERITESADSQEPFHALFRYLKGKQYVWVEARSKQERMPDGSILWDGFFVDITERKEERESLLKIQFAMDRASDSILWVGEEGCIVYANDSACASMGYTREELLTKTVFDIDPDFPRDRWEQHKEDVRRLGNMCFESRHLTKDGRTFPVEVSTNYFDFDGRYLAFAFDRDITDRKRAEEDLRRRVAYENLLSHVSCMAVEEADLQLFFEESMTFMGEIMGVSRSYLFEHRHETDTMDNTHEWCAPGISPQKENLQGLPSAIIPWWMKKLKSGKTICLADVENIPDESTKEILRSQGVLSILAVPLFVQDRYFGFIGFDECLNHRTWPKEDVDFLVSISRIISVTVERRQAEEVLRQNEAKYRFLTENMNDLIWTADLNLRTIYNSPSVEKALGFTQEEWNAAPSEERITPSSFETVRKRLEEELALEASGGADPGRSVTLEIEFYRRDGSTVWMENLITGVRDDEGVLIGIQGVARDITERKHLEEELLKARKLESIGTLAGGIAHEFNNLLMGIQGQTSMMLVNIDPLNPLYGRLKHIEEQVRSGADLTSQLLGFARGGRYEVRPTNLNDLVRKTLAMFGRTRKEIIIHEDYEKDLWTVVVDRSQVEQVFMNLYVNAWHAMPDGGEMYLKTENVLVDEAVPLSPAPGKYVRITVADTGMGMDARTRERVFDPFFTTKGMGRGAGLGLAAVYGIISGHGGRIDVASQPGRGTTFTIHLSAIEEAAAEEEVIASEVTGGTETILLIDDEAMILGIAGEMLESLGYRVYEAGSGEEAVALYSQKKDEIDLVILDMIMPGISGGETFDRLREINAKQKILLSSGYSIHGAAQEILERGCNGFLQKPFHLDQLAHEVRALLDTQ